MITATEQINPNECKYHVDYYDICQKNCFYCKDNIKNDKCPILTERNSATDVKEKR